MKRILANAALLLILAAGCIVALFFFNRAAAPQPKVLPVEGASDPDYGAIIEDVTTEHLREDLDSLCAADTRFTGSPGCDAAADFIEEALRAMGYRTMSQPFSVTVPVTRYARILDEARAPVPDVAIHPLIPNWFRTCTTPTGGVTGVIRLGALGLAREYAGADAGRTIALLPVGTPWMTVASLGVKAVLYFDDGRKTVGGNWAHHQDVSLNVPRFLVTGDALSLTGRTVRIEARVDCEEKTARNVIAFLDPPGGAAEALVVGAYYDAYSYVPDRSPGARQACSPAALLAVARHVASHAQELKRSVVFLASAGNAQGLTGAREFARALGRRETRRHALRDAQKALDNCTAEAAQIEAALVVARDDAYWAAAGEEPDAQYWAARDDDVQDDMIALFRRAVDIDLMESIEAVTRRRVGWIAEGMPVRAEEGQQAGSFEDYMEARAQQRRVEAVLTTPLGAAKERWADYIAAHALPQSIVRTGEARLARVKARQQTASARRDLAEALARYEKVLFLGIDITDRTAAWGLVSGQNDLKAYCRPADSEIMGQLRAGSLALDRVAPEPIYLRTVTRRHRIANMVRANDATGLSFITAGYGAPMYFTSQAFLWTGHTAFTLATHGDTRPIIGTPFDSIERLLAIPEAQPGLEPYVPLSNLEMGTRVLCATVGRMALGHGRLIPLSSASQVYTIRGQVVSRVGESLTPDHPMPGALVRFGPILGSSSTAPAIFPVGMGSDVCLTADEEGRFELPFVWGRALSMKYQSTVDIDAAMLRPEDGEVLWTLSEADSGATAPYSVRNIKIAEYEKVLALPVLFRCKAIQVIPMPDPATLKPYAGFAFVEQRTLAPPQQNKMERSKQSYVCYVPPESRLYFTFRKGSEKNPNLTTIRAFALNATGPSDGSLLEGEPEIYGEGYFVDAHDSVANIVIDAALSMAQVNSRRLRLQKHHNMADEMTMDYNLKACALVGEAIDLQSQGRSVAARRAASDSVAYSSNIHPAIRKNASDAIVGILFYLLLAVPFAVFMEKLLIGSPDIRHQIGFQGLIFVLFFLALRAVHPAYQLVRSSFMILLGFLTFALAVAVTLFLAGRFSGSVRELQKKVQKRAEVADVSRAGAASSAFILGLGHMRKRRVRTGLTTGTLILITFVMLSFTSLTTDVVDLEFAVGKAPYTGMCVRNRDFTDIRSALGPLREMYGKDHIVVQREWAGTFAASKGTAVNRAEYILTRKIGEDQLYDVPVAAFLGVSALEPKVTPVTSAFDVLTRWFETDHEYSCMVPRTVADALRITEADVEAGTASLTYGGTAFLVLGIFDADKMGAILDLDGDSIMPLDVLGLLKEGQQVGASQDDDPTAAPEDIARLPADTVVIMPANSMPARSLTGSVAVAFRDCDYAQARAIIMSHLERSAQPAYYGIDGIAFYGGKFRRRSVEGLLDLLLPIIIAALTVLNTMRGSVYERRDEIYVFNSVGLSPSHIRALFLAEASVYAVIGAVGGYLLAQGLGTGLKALGLTGGLSMNYSSLSSVLVSVVIMAVVFLSSLFPARMAARLAAPADMMTREKHSSSKDVIEIDLPFTFNRRDRVAIVPYFVDWFENFGEGSSGDYFCAPPRCEVRAEAHGGAAPVVRTTTWLKPYDLGVSQDVEVIVRNMPETGDNVATVVMTRKSGDVDSWERCCYAFIGLLRKRFLTWRAVSDEDRQNLLEQGRTILREAAKTGVES